MNKKFLSAVLFGAFMVGTSVTFTGCIDNDEPAGIEELRGAKAELLKAKALVEAAKVELVAAQARHEAANAAIKEAMAKQEEAEAKILEAQAAAAQAQSEADKAQAQAEVEYWKGIAAQNAKELELSLLNLDAELALAKRQYEVIMKQIEIAKTLGSDKEAVSLGWLQNEVDKAFALLYGGTYYDNFASFTEFAYSGTLIGEFEGSIPTIDTGEWDGNGTTLSRNAAGSTESNLITVYATEEDVPEGTTNPLVSYTYKLKKAQQALADAVATKAEGGSDGKNYIPELEVAVETAQFNVEVAENALAKVEEFIKNDAVTTDWRAEFDKLEAEINDLTKQLADKQLELEKAQNTDAYIAADQKLNGVYNYTTNADGTMTKGDKVAPGSADMLAEAKKKTDKKFTDEKFSADAYTVNKEITSTMSNAINAKIEATEYDVDATKNAAVQAAVKAVVDANQVIAAIDKKNVTYTRNTANLTPGKISSIVAIDNFASYIAAVKGAGVSDNQMENADLLIAGLEEKVEEAQEDYDAAVDAWEIAVKAKTGVPTDVPTADLDKAVDAYNTAAETLKTKTDAYVTAYKAAVTAEADKLEDEYMLDKSVGAMSTSIASAIQTALDAAKISVATAADAEGFFWGDASNGAQKAMTELSSSSLKDWDNFKKIIKNNSKAQTGTNAKTVDQVAAAVEAAIDEYVADQITNATKKEWQANALKYVGDNVHPAAKGLLKAEYNAVFEATKGAQDVAKKAYEDLSTAVEKFYDLAEDTYARVFDKEVSKLTGEATAQNLVATGNKDFAGVISVDTYDPTKESFSGIGAPVVDKTKFATLVATKLGDETVVNNALAKTSKAAFGLENYSATEWILIEPTLAEVKAVAGYSATNALQALETAKENLQAKEDILAAAEDLEALATELDAQYAALTKEFADWKTAKFDAVIKAEIDAQKARNADYDALQDLKDANKEITIASAKISSELNAVITVSNKLAEAVEQNLGVKISTTLNEAGLYEIQTDGTYDYTDAVTFTEDLKKAALALKAELATVKKSLVAKENALNKAQNEGTFDAVAKKQLELNVAQNAYDLGLANLAKAEADLEAALAVMSAE